jgi:hypothetical protein
MDHYPPGGQKGDSRDNRRAIDDPFILDEASGIYKPKTYRGKKAKYDPDVPRILVEVRTPRDRYAFTLTAIATIISAFTLLVIAIYTYYAGEQWRQMIRAADATEESAGAAKSAADTARDTLIAGSRAWIAPVNASITSDISPNIPLEFSVSFKNSGRSPALDMHPIYVLDKIPSSKLTDNTINDFIEAKDVCKGIAVKPGAQVAYPDLPDTFNFKVGLPGWVDNGVVSGDTTLMVRMCFVYRTMKEIHRTSFCYYYRVGFSPSKQMNVCPVGSHAD